MLLPQELKLIKGIKNKKRDLLICLDYIDGLNPEEIREKRKITLSERRIFYILSNNMEFINPRMAWDKSKRLHRLQRIAKNLPDTITKSKDILDVLKEIREEIEGDKSKLGISDNSVKVYIINGKQDGKDVSSGEGRTTGQRVDLVGEAGASFRQSSS